MKIVEPRLGFFTIVTARDERSTVVTGVRSGLGPQTLAEKAFLRRSEPVASPNQKFASSRRGDPATFGGADLYFKAEPNLSPGSGLTQTMSHKPGIFLPKFHDDRYRFISLFDGISSGLISAHGRSPLVKRRVSNPFRAE
jgi:hypothetical protein